MKTVRHIFMFLSAVVLLAACRGTVDETSLPFLKASSTKIDLAEETQVEFTVTFNGTDVTAEAEIISDKAGDALAENMFTPSEEGDYVFHAVYDGRKSENVKVEVADTRVRIESKYNRRVCLMELTGAWCTICPEGYTKMMSKLQRPSMADYRDYIHIAAFHSSSGGADPLAISESDVLVGMFKGMAFPGFIVDLRNIKDHYGLLDDAGAALLEPSLKKSFTDYPAHCGVAVSSVLNDDRTAADVTVRVSSEYTSVYSVILLVVEDDIKSMQKDPPLYPDGREDYNHKHVVRKVVKSDLSGFSGIKITEDGKIPAGEEASNTWNIEVDGAWKLDDTQIYALVLDVKGHVNNMNVCTIGGGSSDFDFKE